jgi:hypothetical protein
MGVQLSPIKEGFGLSVLENRELKKIFRSEREEIA